MRRILLLIIVLIVSLLVACTSEEQKVYEDALQQAKDKITAEEFVEAQRLLTKAVSAGYEESAEAGHILDQLQQYQELEDLLNEGKFEEVYKAIDGISQIENGSTIISTKAKEFRATTEQHQQQYNRLQTKINESLKLVDNEKYDEANEQLMALDLTDYQASYYESIKTTIAETIASNNKQIAAAIKAEEQRRAEEARQLAEEKARAEAARKNNMLNWTDEEIEQYIADYLGMNANHVIVEVYDRTNSGYSIDTYQDNEALGNGDPGVATALGFFEVRDDGKLYKMDILSGDYILLN
ncbi:hypothetical protein [Metabacillus endolithicus]|uniref:Lipoprotein n=1 Tax=Metabacillus endolithicus TaxID=1535204 RepID=A0ABW5C1N1_9BACI|nr:hypothetical protein [Metabacillus endolithicus]UPG65527.1 hypothetical protein MVE64_11460 [Metabacillus endolithicus]